MRNERAVKGTILVVDDVPVNIVILEEILSRHGYEILTAADGREALQQLEEKLPDLILLDVMLPDHSGFNICKKLKKDEKTRDIPVIFITALVEVKDKLEGFAAGAVDYVTKPFNGVEILARVNTHIQLKQSQDLVKQYSEQLEVMLERRTKELIKTERQATFAQLLQGIVHNMRNPITYMLGGLGLMEMTWKEVHNQLKSQGSTELTERFQVIDKYMDLIQRGVKKLDIMVNNMMGKSKRDTGEQVERVDLNDIIRQELAFYELELHAYRKISKTVELIDQKLLVDVIAPEIAQVFSNFYQNAHDALYESTNGSITIRTGRTGESAWFSLQDNGPGISQDVMKKIFEPFFTTKPAKQDAAGAAGAAGAGEPVGTGLGLYYCKEIVGTYGGDIRMETKAGTGTTFIVYLPLSEAH